MLRSKIYRSQSDEIVVIVFVIIYHVNVHVLRQYQCLTDKQLEYHEYTRQPVMKGFLCY